MTFFIMKLLLLNNLKYSISQDRSFNQENISEKYENYSLVFCYYFWPYVHFHLLIKIKHYKFRLLNLLILLIDVLIIQFKIFHYLLQLHQLNFII